MVRGPVNKAAGRMHTVVNVRLVVALGAGGYWTPARNSPDVGQTADIANTSEYSLRLVVYRARFLGVQPAVRVAGSVAHIDELAEGALASEGDFLDHGPGFLDSSPTGFR